MEKPRNYNKGLWEIEMEVGDDGGRIVSNTAFKHILERDHVHKLPLRENKTVAIQEVILAVREIACLRLVLRDGSSTKAVGFGAESLFLKT